MCYNKSKLESVTTCVLLHSCRVKMLLLLYTCYFSIFLSSFMSFHTLVHSVWELWYRCINVWWGVIQTNLQQTQPVGTKTAFGRKKKSCSFFIPFVFALQSVWVKTGALQWWRNWKPHKWMDVRVALEQFTGSDGMRDSILFIYYMYHEEKKVCSAADPWESCFWHREASERETVSLKEANYGSYCSEVWLFWAVLMLCQKYPITNHSHCLNHQFCTN